MVTGMTDLDELYARLASEEDDDDGVIVKENEVSKTGNFYVLVGRFLTNKNVNFNVMKNVITSLWRPKEGMEIHDIGEHRYSFIFYHILDMQKVFYHIMNMQKIFYHILNMQKVLEGGPGYLNKAYCFIIS